MPLGTSYSLVTNEGYCVHVSGSRVINCRSIQSDSESNCRSACTFHRSCIGYYYYSQTSRCYLIPSEYRYGSSDNCPEGYLVSTTSLILATWYGDLVGYTSPGYVCYVRNDGKHLYMEILFDHI